MATFYKGIEYVSNPTEEVVYHKNQTFSASAEGINSVQFRSESLRWHDSSGLITHTTTGSHYHFVNYFLNDSASFDGYGGKLHKHKLYPSGSVIYIPQQYYGERIKPKTFKLTDNSTSETILIQDDGYGNLYSSNAKFSQSVSHASASDNYIGNIHYETGVVLITETGSWSGSVGGNGTEDINYTDVGTAGYKVDFNSTMTIHQNELVLKVKAHEFNATANNTIFKGQTSEIIDSISSSLDDFGPYATTIAFYQERPSILYNKTIDKNNTIEYTGDDVEFYTPETKAVLLARFPKPVKISNTDDLTIIIKYDT